MSTTHRALGASFSWLLRLAGAVTVTAALTVGASTATAATAFAGPTPDPDPHSDTRSDDRSDDDSETGSELEPGARVDDSSTGPRVVSGLNQEWLGEVHGMWRYVTEAGAGDWREAPYGQLVTTGDAVWVEVTGGPRSWCLDGPTGQQRFPKKADAVVRCG